MYELLTVSELSALQRMLYEGTEHAYLAAIIEEGNSAWVERYHPVHRELGCLFIEAGTELLQRIDQPLTVA
jgi:hypothetical protein